MEMKSAYRNVSIHADDRALLEMHWGNWVFIEKTLPFGLHSAPKGFSAVTDALE